MATSLGKGAEMITKQQYLWARVNVFDDVISQSTFWENVWKGRIPRPRSGYVFLQDNLNLLSPVRITHTKQYVTPATGRKKKPGIRTVIEYGSMCYDYHALKRLNERGTYGTVQFTPEYLWRDTRDTAGFFQLFFTAMFDLTSKSDHSKFWKEGGRLENPDCVVPHHHGAWVGFVSPVEQDTVVVVERHRGVITNATRTTNNFALFNAKTWIPHHMMGENQLAICKLMQQGEPA